MSEIATGGRAFPSEYTGQYGMTLRDWFAGQAIGGIITAHTRVDGGYQVGLVVNEAYLVADAMIAESIKADEANEKARTEAGHDLPF